MAPAADTKPVSTANSSLHTTVLLNEAVESLRPHPGGIYIDCTFGGGGHTLRILNDPADVARVIAIDADADALDRAKKLSGQPGIGDRLQYVHANFRELDQVIAGLEIERVDGILLDLGLSSFQLDQGERGFSFRYDSPLDMRFDQTAGQSAAALINTLSQEDLTRLIWRYGEDHQARRIAAGLVRERGRAPLSTTGQVAAIIEAVVGGRRGRAIHPATRTFQALRIAVNDELEALREVLPIAVRALAPGGRLAVIAFHSLEDRIVKRWIEAESSQCACPPEQPVCTCHRVPTLRRVGKPIRPSGAEVEANSRSRSAILRVAERLDDGGRVIEAGPGS